MFYPHAPPLFPSVFTDLFGHIFNHQENQFCDDFELRMANCVEAYGLPLAETKCKDYMDDFYECVTGARQVQRQLIMLKERNRQFKAGLRKQPYEKDHTHDIF